MHRTGEALDSSVIQQMIAERAYDIWENQGRPFGHHLLHWQQAEREILDCLAGQAAEEASVDAIGTKKDAALAEAA